MEERVLVKSQPINVKKVFLTFIIIGAVLSVGLYAWFVNWTLKYVRTFTEALGTDLWAFSLIPVVAMTVIGLLVYLWLRSYEMTVTDKRVYGKVIFGKRVDLPVDSVSATGTIAMLKGVSVSTSSGRISFLAIKNAEEIFKIVNSLLVERQYKKNEVAAPVVATTDEADQLQKFKKLLDDGVITQEEFDAKKKQILGL